MGTKTKMKPGTEQKGFLCVFVFRLREVRAQTQKKRGPEASMRRTLDFGQFDFGELAEVEIGRSGRSRNWLAHNINSGFY